MDKSLVFTYIENKGNEKAVGAALSRTEWEQRGVNDLIELVLAVKRDNPEAVILEGEHETERTDKILDYFAKSERYMVTALILPEDGKLSTPGRADMYISAPVRAGDLIAKLRFGAARKERLKILDRELDETEKKFSGQRNRQYAVSLIMEERGLNEKEAGEYLDRVSLEYGSNPSDVADMAYEIFLLTK